MKTSHLGIMNKIPVNLFADAESLARQLARYICDSIAKATAKQRPFYLGCPTGRSPFETYQHMGRVIAERQQDLSCLVLVMMDDYVVPAEEGGFQLCRPDAHYSCRRFAYTDMQDVFNAGIPSGKQLTRDRIWFPDPNDPGAYDQRIANAGGVDLFIVASGASDGHLAFNPAGLAVNSPSRIVELTDATRTDNLGTFPEFKEITEVPTHGLSIGLHVIAALSKEIVLILHGAHKAPSVERLNTLSSFDENWPVSIVFDARGSVTAYIDESAGRSLIAEGASA